MKSKVEGRVSVPQRREETVMVREGEEEREFSEKVLEIRGRWEGVSVQVMLRSFTMVLRTTER